MSEFHSFIFQALVFCVFVHLFPFIHLIFPKTLCIPCWFEHGYLHNIFFLCVFSHHSMALLPEAHHFRWYLPIYILFIVAHDASNNSLNHRYQYCVDGCINTPTYKHTAHVKRNDAENFGLIQKQESKKLFAFCSSFWRRCDGSLPIRILAASHVDFIFKSH